MKIFPIQIFKEPFSRQKSLFPGPFYLRQLCSLEHRPRFLNDSFALPQVEMTRREEVWITVWVTSSHNPLCCLLQLDLLLLLTYLGW